VAAPSKGTPADKRLAANKPAKKAPAKAAPFGGKQAPPFGSKGKGGMAAGRKMPDKGKPGC
jgi:hypothetical protein